MRMRLSLLAPLVLLVLALPSAGAQSRDDSLAIRATALDYIDGWYTGNPERMERALHPELAKRIMFADTLGNAWISDMGATQLVRNVRAGGGTRTPADQQRRDVAILDIFQNTASVRVDAAAWVYYLHLVKWKGRWVILNVLWELRRPPAPSR